MFVKSEMSGSLWKLLVKEGDRITADQEVAILESMKMEIPITSSIEGTVAKVNKAEGDFVQEDEVILELKA
ncbi:acetyl-CoA carboxylase biotin carboxyl carrier protein subunit [Sporosarcina sp. FSL W7-1349]|uniref:acetyl-CoA carboxylase biotin carboxyl carrier protein subunit n=1 Tax=Sporosarcina sp. FSL W7-1349 TaxID=2921561 RepID=UPI0030FCCCE5